MPRGREQVIGEMGGAYPELRERAATIADVALDEEKRFRATLDRGLKLLEEEFAGLKKGGKTGAGRGGVHALRHLRVSRLISPRSSPASAASASTSRASRPRWNKQRARQPIRRLGQEAVDGEAQGGGARGRRDQVPRLRRPRHDGEGVVKAILDGQRVQPRGRRAGRARLRPDAVLRRDPAARSATPAGRSAGERSRSTNTEEAGRRRARAVRRGHRGSDRGRRRGDASRSTTSAASGSAPTTRRRTCCTTRSSTCSAITSRRRARWSRPIGCASTSRTSRR